jgi:Kef-type K+ transport system membrane component KefB
MTLLLLQMAIVLLTALVCGWAARRLGQARVIGEIAGGILIGPSLFGRIAPGASARLFPQSSFGALDALSTIGLVLFLFLIGTELEYEHLRTQRGTALLASTMNILFPFAIALTIANALYIAFAPAGIGRVPFALFLGISMSITALPVLAKILEERGLQSTPMGTTALMCAAVNDVCAWLLLAVGLTLVPQPSESMSLLVRLMWLGMYLAVMLIGVRPLAGWVARRQHAEGLSYEMLGVVIAVLLASAAATEAIGIHPLFGAFLAGVCFPRIPSWQNAVRKRLETIVSILLLPLFFALTGMKTRLDLLSGTTIWMWTGIVLVAAVTGKMGGTVLAARWTGQSWQDAFALGTLLNTRGLVELIVLNMAYNAHVFSPALFTMLVVMALVTTMMTNPILNLLGIEDRRSDSRDFAAVSPAP